jgi:hypothetical protein
MKVKELSPDGIYETPFQYNMRNDPSMPVALACLILLIILVLIFTGVSILK